MEMEMEIEMEIDFQMEKYEKNPKGKTKSWPMFPPAQGHLLAAVESQPTKARLRKRPSSKIFKQLVRSLELSHAMPVYPKGMKVSEADQFQIKR
jgi:hypothetical protein